MAETIVEDCAFAKGKKAQLGNFCVKNNRKKNMYG